MKRGLIVLILVMMIACAQEQVPTQEIQIVETKFPDVPKYEPPPSSPIIESGYDEIKIEAIKYKFMPSFIDVKKGQKVRLIITAVDSDHNFFMPSFGIDEELPFGEDIIIEFTPKETGTYLYMSKGEVKQGMRGELKVK